MSARPVGCVWEEDAEDASGLPGNGATKKPDWGNNN